MSGSLAAPRHALALLGGLLWLGCGAAEAPLERVHIPSPPEEPAEHRVAEAISTARDAVAEAPETGLAWGRLGMVLDAHDYGRAASTCYERAAELAPDDFRWRYHRALAAAREAKEVERVVELFQQAASLEPDYPPLHYRLSITMQRHGRYEEAEAAAVRAVELAPEMGAAWRQLGQVRLAREDPAGAAQALHEATSRNPDDSMAHASLALALARLGDDDGARQSTRLARRAGGNHQMPDPVRAEVAALGVSANRAYERGQAALAAGDLVMAIELLRIKTEVSPSPSSEHLLGVAHRRSGNSSEAAAHFTRAIEMADHPESHWQLGALLIEQGQGTEGLLHLMRARELASADAGLMHAIGSDLARSGLLDEAMEAFAASAELDADNASLYADWCGALLQQGSLDRALEQCHHAVQLDESLARAHLHLGLVLEADGQGAKARAHYQRALELDPESRARDLLARSTVQGPGGRW